MTRLVSIAVLALASARCQLPPELAAGDAGAEHELGGACAICVTADGCCAAHTANPESNCQLFATCQATAADERATVTSGCAYYLRVASTPPAPAACGPHPDP